MLPSRRPWFSGLRISLMSSCSLARGMGMILLILGGCQPSHEGSFGAKGPEEVRPSIALLLQAVPGQAVRISDPDFGNVVAVLERIYPSASGQSCRRFALHPANDPDSLSDTLVMCQESGGWSLVKPPTLRY